MQVFIRNPFGIEMIYMINRESTPQIIDYRDDLEYHNRVNTQQTILVNLGTVNNCKWRWEWMNMTYVISFITKEQSLITNQ